MAETIFHKTCKHCGKEFTSTARNTRYCSNECCDAAQVVNKAKKRKCAKRRKAYDENRELNRLISRAYSLSQAVGAYLPKVCADHDDPNHTCEGPMELHHKDGNPFNCSPSNLEWRCRRSHEDIQKTLPVFTVVDILKEAFLQENPQKVYHEYFYERGDQ